MDKEQNFEGVRGFSLGSFAVSWEQRKFEDIAVRSSSISSESGLPRVEYEDIISKSDYFYIGNKKS